MRQRERHVDVGDTRLYVAERGDGFPVVVLHGGPGLDHTMFADYLDPLTDHYRLLLVDQRSQGRSDKTSRETWTIERMAADVTALAESLGLGGSYAVLGHSFGAFVALRHAVDFSGRPAGTIVSSGLPDARWMGDVEAAIAAFEPAELRERIQRAWATEETAATPEERAAALADQWPWHFADPRDPRIATFAEACAGIAIAHDVNQHFAETGFDGLALEDRLAGVEHPVLVLTGRKDRMCPVEAAEAIAHGIPNGELYVLEHSGHMGYVEEQDRFLEVVRDFLDRVRR